MKIKNIIFYYPSRQTGGTQYLFMRYATQLSKTEDRFNIMYVDYPDGFAKTQLQNEKINFLDYYENRISIPSDSLVIFQLNKVPLFQNEITFDKDKTAFMFWYLHVTNLHDYVFARGIHLLTNNERKKAGECIDFLIDHDSINFLNADSYIDFIKDFFTGPHRVNVIPLILPTDEFNERRVVSDSLPSPIRICWLGRLDEEKSRNILTYMNELEVINSTIAVKMALIGIGPAMDYLKAESTKYSFPVEFVGEKRDSDLDYYIRNNVDIGLASGTSSLEFGLRGIPVIEQWVIPKIYKSGEISNYTHVFDRPKIDLTKTTRRNLTEDIFARKFMEIIDNYTSMVYKSYEYAIGFSPQEGAKRLLKSIENIEKNYNDKSFMHIIRLSKLLNKGIVRRNILSFIKTIVTFSFLRKSKKL